ncbi:MAG: homoserine dehydrogenase [Phycisphaerae bacterium]
MAQAKTVRIALAGCGTVGGGVARLLSERRADLADRCGLDLRVVRVLVRDLGRTRSGPLSADLLTTRPQDLLDNDIDLVVELIGGCDTAREIVLSAVRAGKPVVTANKALIALHGGEIFEAARAAGVPVGIEASCCGGIPVIGAIRHGLAANRIDALDGIVNGTCNYILTEMLERQKPYAGALADAQRLGYAEADPTLDVDGTDSAHKLVILASLAFHLPIDIRRVRCEGIDQLALNDLLAGSDLGYVCKLVAQARRFDDGLALQVGPVFMEKTHPLAHVGGPFNAVSVQGHAVGHTFYLGRGAGAMPTASAVVADIIEVASNPQCSDAFPAADPNNPPFYKPLDELDSRFYVRVPVRDDAGVTGLFAEHEISVSAVNTISPDDGTPAQEVSVVVITQQANRGRLRRALKALTGLESIAADPVAIRILDPHPEM